MTGLETQIFDVCHRSVMKVFAHSKPTHQYAILNSTHELMVDLVVLPKEEREGKAKLTAKSYEEWTVLNSLFDEISKEIPAADSVEIIGEGLTRSERNKYLAARGE